MLTIPYWVYFIVAGIIFCAYMMVKSIYDEQRIETEEAEKEGAIYMQRLEQEKERRGLIKATEE